MLQLLAHNRPSSFQLDWHTIVLPHFSLTGNQYSSDCSIVSNNIEENQPASVAVYTHKLFSHEEMTGIKCNTQSIQNSTRKLEPWALRKKYSSG